MASSTIDQRWTKTVTAGTTTGGSGLDELVEDGVDGFIVQNEQEMAERFVESVKNQSWSQLGQSARAKALKYDQKILFESDIIT